MMQPLDVELTDEHLQELEVTDAPALVLVIYDQGVGDA